MEGQTLLMPLRIPPLGLAGNIPEKAKKLDQYSNYLYHVYALQNAFWVATM